MLGFCFFLIVLSLTFNLITFNLTNICRVGDVALEFYALSLSIVKSDVQGYLLSHSCEDCGIMVTQETYPLNSYGSTNDALSFLEDCENVIIHMSL